MLIIVKISILGNLNLRAHEVAVCPDRTQRDFVLTLSSTTATLPPVRLMSRLRQRTRRPLSQVQEPKKESLAFLDSAPQIGPAPFLDHGDE